MLACDLFKRMKPWDAGVMSDEEVVAILKESQSLWDVKKIEYALNEPAALALRPSLSFPDPFDARQEYIQKWQATYGYTTFCKTNRGHFLLTQMGRVGAQLRELVREIGR